MFVVIGEAEERSKAPAALDAVEMQVDIVNRSNTGRTDGLDETTVVAVVVVGSDTKGSREVVINLTSDVQLSTVDILLALHIGDISIIRRHHPFRCEHSADRNLEHGDALVVLHETTATHDTDHRGECPVTFLIGGKKGGHDGCRGLTIVCLVETGAQIAWYISVDVAVLPGLLEVE